IAEVFENGLQRWPVATQGLHEIDDDEDGGGQAQSIADIDQELSRDVAIDDRALPAKPPGAVTPRAGRQAAKRRQASRKELEETTHATSPGGRRRMGREIEEHDAQQREQSDWHPMSTAPWTKHRDATETLLHDVMDQVDHDAAHGR